jgi:hypothetical protein
MLQLQFIIVPAVTLLFILVTLALIIIGRIREGSWFSDSWGIHGWGVGAVFTGVVATIMTLVSVVLFIPFNAKYLTFNEVVGKVDTATNRFVSGTGDLSGDYILRISGQPGVYNVQDDRIQGVKVGDRVDLTCTVEWVYAGQDQNNCFIRSW